MNNAGFLSIQSIRESQLSDLSNQIDKLKEENKILKEKINQYENPDDMTLMFMWCDEKAKDEIKRLNNIINELDKQNKQLGTDLSIIKDILNKTNWWLEEMLNQEKDNHTKAIINGALELLLKDSDK